MPFDAAGFPNDGAKPTARREARWLRYSIAVLLILAIVAVPAWSLWQIASHALWSL